MFLSDGFFIQLSNKALYCRFNKLPRDFESIKEIELEFKAIAMRSRFSESKTFFLCLVTTRSGLGYVQRFQNWFIKLGNPQILKIPLKYIASKDNNEEGITSLKKL